MKIEREKKDAELTLRLSGRLETATAPELQKVVDEELENVGQLRIDMKELEYVSSAGLRVLLSATKRMRAKGGEMIVSNANENIRDVFKITGFDSFLTVV